LSADSISPFSCPDLLICCLKCWNAASFFLKLLKLSSSTPAFRGLDVYLPAELAPPAAAGEADAGVIPGIYLPTDGSLAYISN